MGELEFYSDSKNQTSVITLDFCSVLYLQKSDFLSEVNKLDCKKDWVI